MKSILFIINPIAGTKLRKVNKESIAEKFPADQFDVEIVETEYSGHAKILAEKAVTNKIDIVVVAGGDGSIREVAPVLLNTNIILGIIPSGSGNGVAHHMKIPINIQKSLDIIKHGKIQKVDIAFIENKEFGKEFFLSVCGLGFDAEVIHHYSKVKARGFFTYLYFMIWAVFSLRRKKVRIQFNDFDRQLKPFVFTIANSSQYGYSIEVAPFASITDGSLDALLVEDANVIRVIRFAVLSLLKMRKKVLKVADYYKTEKIDLHFPETTRIQIDGEPFFALGETSVRIVKHGLTVLSPE